MNVLELVQHAADTLRGSDVSYGQGTLNADDEAAWLVLWRLGLPLDALPDVSEQAVTPAQVTHCNALVELRIASRKPAAYLTQEAWLQGVSFFVDERSIVPRSLIAELIADGGFDTWLRPDTTQVLDLCTGNGSLAVLAAMAFPDVRVDAADLSADALEVAAINVSRHRLQDRIRLLRSDGLQDCGYGYDLVLCNPPYVNAQSMAALPLEFKAEPPLALAGGDDGMDFVRRLVRELPRHLSEHGVLVLEIGHERAHFEAAFPRLEAVWLETSAGFDLVCLLTRDALNDHLKTTAP